MDKRLITPYKDEEVRKVCNILSHILKDCAIDDFWRTAGRASERACKELGIAENKPNKERLLDLSTLLLPMFTKYCPGTEVDILRNDKPTGERKIVKNGFWKLGFKLLMEDGSIHDEVRCSPVSNKLVDDHVSVELLIINDDIELNRCGIRNGMKVKGHRVICNGNLKDTVKVQMPGHEECFVALKINAECVSPGEYKNWVS